MSSTATAAIETFLADFVAETRHDQARDALCDLFATLHAALALQFVRTYAPEPTPLPKAPAPVPTKPEAKLCTGVTAKGAPCAHKCCADAPDAFCAVHLQQSLKAPKPPSSTSKKAMRAQAPACTGVTTKGAPCVRKCCPDSDAFCAAHLAQSLKPAPAPKVSKTAKAPPVPKEPKVKTKAAKVKTKAVPAHNHPLTEEVEADAASNCDLCQSHGNAASQGLTGVQFEEISGDLQSRLRDILANLNEVESDGEEDEEDEDEEDEEAESKPLKAKPKAEADDEGEELEADDEGEDEEFGQDALESDADDDESEADEEEDN
jgi:hypothetical protein